MITLLQTWAANQSVRMRKHTQLYEYTTLVWLVQII